MHTRKKTGKTGPSRDGHEYHEMWTARKALQLLRSDTDLNAIAIEGLSPIDQVRASTQTIEIADLVLYYGGSVFEKASRTSFVQFKYSVASKDLDFRASHAKKTIQKYAKTYCEYLEMYGDDAVLDKLDFQLITNQPIYEQLLLAIDAIAHGLSCTGDIEKQAMQFKAAAGLVGEQLSTFASKFKLYGSSGNLPTIKYELASLLVDWSATQDSIAAARLGQLKNLVRDKAGYAGTNRNLIIRTDILAVFQVSDLEDLLPCPSALTDVGEVLDREQLADAIAMIPTLSVPLLVHAAGGVGKTVFLESMAARIAEHCEVLFFDCFGGGAYRSPADARHLPKRGLVHIANTLAFRGLCDPILPDTPDEETLLRTFRRRLVQCISTTRVTKGRELVLFIDAIDNADYAASKHSEDSFPFKLLELLDSEPIPGLKIVVSCRTERKPVTYAHFHELILRPFSINETSAFLKSRFNKVSQVEINVAYARSGGNARVLAYLVENGKSLLDESEIDKKIELDELIQKRISDAIATAIERGYDQNVINAFLAGLAVLPPPVPLEEYAGAHGIELSAIESFASDLFPLLERSNQGLMFKDEPTETLIHTRYASSLPALRRLADNLFARQDVSVYAARALPGLLHELDDGDQLFKLAFDERIPASITSTVGKRNIRYARLKASTLHAAMKGDYNHLVRLLLELSTIAEVDQRGSAYIVGHPDLIVAAKDVDANRRLFETHTGWPGTRHARLTIANTLSGELQEASRHAVSTNEWIDHYRRTDREEERRKTGPEKPDIAAIPFFLISEGRALDAVKFLQGWKDWYAYEVCECIFDYSYLAQLLGTQSSDRLMEFIDALADIGPLTAALSFHELSIPKRKQLLEKLAKLCNKTSNLSLSESYHQDHNSHIEDGLRMSSALAFSLGLEAEALAISLHAPHQRPSIWDFSSPFGHEKVFPFVFRTAIVAEAKKTFIHEKDVLPEKLESICSCLSMELEGAVFREQAKKILSGYIRKQCDEVDETSLQNKISYEDKENAERFIDRYLEPLLAFTKVFSLVLAASSVTVNKSFIGLLHSWDDACKNHDSDRSGEIHRFFEMLGLDAVMFVLSVRSELTLESVAHFLATVQKYEIGTHRFVQIVAILAKRSILNELAGTLAQKTRTLIEAEDDVNFRASLFARLGRAMLPASIDEASEYFRNGLEQMDMIGSGDYAFTNELLLFASALNGEELDEHYFHTLSNICELNMGEEPERFFWGAYGRGLSKTAGLRGLAKLSRWDDRSKVSLAYTLMPYLTALVEDGKLDSKNAIALNYLAESAESYQCGTKEFAQAIREKDGLDPDVILEIINQFEANNPGIAMDSTIEVLVSLAEEALGQSSETTRQISDAQKRYTIVRDTLNEHRSSQNFSKSGKRNRIDKIVGENREAIDRISAGTNPLDSGSLVLAINAFNDLQSNYELKGIFFDLLRAKVPFRDRSIYIRNICKLEHLFFYWKFAELTECKRIWGESSASLDKVYKSEANNLIRLHAHDLVNQGRLSGSDIKEISDFTGIQMAELVLELIKVFARPDMSISGAVWLAFAAFISQQVDYGQGQKALMRLLDSSASKLANNVTDGPIFDGLYPNNKVPEIIAGLVWRVLGSPNASDRWRAAHSVRCFAKFGRWEIIGSLICKLNNRDAGPFQAPELAFYYLHARLWLLITIARIAIDYPEEIARFKNPLLSVATEDKDPHVLMRHFAARALLICVKAGKICLSEHTEMCIRTIDLSPYPRLRKKIRNGNDDFFYARGCPDSKLKPEFEFHLDYDFHKHDVDSLSRIFGQPCRKVADMLSEIVHHLDPTVYSMYESGGRESRHRRTSYGISTRHHTFGHQLGWHALFYTAGKLLAMYPVTDDYWYEEDPWGKWLESYLLTREDGLWLSDGTDKTPLDTTEILLETGNKVLAVTGDSEKLLKLVGFTNGVGREFVAEGQWFSPDNIRIHISSALISPDKSNRIAQKLTRGDPFFAFIPVFYGNENDAEELKRSKSEYTPWIVRPSGESRLDEHDPYCVSTANFRPYLIPDYAAFLSISCDEPFGRVWKDTQGNPILYAQAWGREDKDSENGPHSGIRLICSSLALKKILSEYNKELLLLIKLERTEKVYQGDSKRTHTIAVVRITKTLEYEYFKGRINHLHKSRY